jgi:hypothetical protein
MPDDKIDRKLQAEMERLEKTGRSDQRLTVLIEHAASIEPGGQGAEGISAVEERIRAAQQKLRTRLTKMGAQQVRQMSLSNALVADLTPAQIREIASDGDVKRLLWNVPEKVTA